MSRIHPDEIKEMLSYDPETGVFRWNHLKIPPYPAWNTKFAGKKAGKINGDGYVSIRIKGKDYLAHRLAILVSGQSLDGFVDHVNGSRTDNRLSNIRVVSRGENARNQKRHSTNRSGHTGVTWNSRIGKWQAQVKRDGQNCYIGVFAEITDAIDAVSDARAKLGFHKNHGRSA